MNAIDAQMRKLTEHIDVVIADFRQLAEAMGKASEEDARSAIVATSASLARVARAARSVRAACPKCSRPDSKMEFEAVNKLSGVWKLPRCETCRDLAELISEVDRCAKAAEIGEES